MISVSAFNWVPEPARGHVRDLRVRWALEEAGLPYGSRLLEMGDQDKPDYRALQPFGQVPILEEDGFALFESGAIVLHIGERSEALLPKAPGRSCPRSPMALRGAQLHRALRHECRHHRFRLPE
jgi:glutathione S-transferase